MQFRVLVLQAHSPCSCAKADLRAVGRTEVVARAWHAVACR